MPAAGTGKYFSVFTPANPPHQRVKYGETLRKQLIVVTNFPLANGQ